MRLVMMGTGPFAEPTFRGLFETGQTIVALVTGPLKMRGARPIHISPMRHVALENGVAVFDPADLNTLESRRHLRDLDADLLVVCDYGTILSAETLATARLGGINLHASLLPKYRGAAPINWAILDGATETGVSVIHMTPRVDAGPVVAQGRTEIDPRETAVELEARLAEMGDWLIRRTIDTLAAGSLQALPQDPALASTARRLKKADGVVDWTRPAPAIKDQVRALEPWPKTYTYWHRPTGAPVRVILGPVRAVERADLKPAPGPKSTFPAREGAASEVGIVLQTSGGRVVVAAGGGTALVIDRLQPAGKRMLSAEEFLRGNRLEPGHRFGPESV